MKGIIDNLEDLKHFKKPLVLYSGGLDSSYALLWAKRNGIEVLAYRGVVMEQNLPQRVLDFLNYVEIPLIEKNLVEELLTDFITKGILAGGYYQNRFPISSSYTRPLIAKYAAIAAKENGCDCIVHTTNFHQNSAARFNNAIMFHAPGIPIAIPYIKSVMTREEKLKDLTEAGYEIEGSIYSVDENIWCRVIENNDLDYVQNPVIDKHFKWTVNNQAENQELALSLTFENGVPVGIDGNGFNLSDIVKKLNEVGSLFSIGRYNGLEDTPIGIKNHEIREAPAAEIIYKGKGFLESAVLNQNELRFKMNLDYRWAELVVNGNWYTLEKEAIDAALAVINKQVSGTIQLLLRPNFVFPQGVSSVNSLDFNSLSPIINEAKASFSYSEYYLMQNIYNQIRFS